MSKRAYLDYASTAPIRPVALAAMNDALAMAAADPARLHTEGLQARHSIEAARDDVANFLGARNREVVFTSGATESIATVAAGFAGEHQIVSAVEHPAVTRAVEAAGPFTTVSVDELGRIDLVGLSAAITPKTTIVHAQLGNQETGTIQPVAQIAELCKEAGVLLHVDATQAAGHTPIDFGALGLDFLSLSAHKLGGPPGIGALVIRRGLRISPLLTGGSQERARRAGFENLPAIAGFAAACKDIDIAASAVRERELVDHLRLALGAIERVTVFTPAEHSLSHILCIGIEDVEPQAVLLDLDRAGISAHSGAACASEELEPSPVLLAMGLDAHHSLRFSLGWKSNSEEVTRAARETETSLLRLRKLSTR